jgi:hypothetical protein
VTLRILALLLLSGCVEAPIDDDDDDAPQMRQTDGVSVDIVTINQGVQRTLMEDGAQPDGAPLVEGRDALVRVHAVTDSDYDGAEVTARLWIGDSFIDTVATLEEPSHDDLDSTLNFDVSGDLIGDTLDWTVQLLQEKGGEDNPNARADGEVEVEGAVNVFRMVIAPFSYEFDGSGRLPDTSPEQIERIRETFLKVYPVTDVEITVRDPEPINVQLQRDGTGWVQAGIPLIGYRQTDGASDDTYYYGMFNPAESLSLYCGFGGCLLGVTLLNNNPPDVGSVTLRVALGVGFREQAPWVAVHEIGHAHGRAHTPCAPPNNPPADPDPSYPYADGSIGTWGWDIVTGDLVPPETTDFMGYCEDQWSSEFTWTAMHDRGQNVNEGLGVPGPLRTWDVVAVDRDGAVWGTSIDRRTPFAGEDVDVTVDGVKTKARYVRWDHMPGGLLVFPRLGDGPRAATFTVDGRELTATR